MALWVNLAESQKLVTGSRLFRRIFPCRRGFIRRFLYDIERILCSLSFKLSKKSHFPTNISNEIIRDKTMELWNRISRYLTHFCHKYDYESWNNFPCHILGLLSDSCWVFPVILGDLTEFYSQKKLWHLTRTRHMLSRGHAWVYTDLDACGALTIAPSRAVN